MEEYFNEVIEIDKDLGILIKKGIEEYAIQDFDSELLSRLRRIYYSAISGLLYFLAERDYSRSHGNKMEMLAYVLEDEDYEIVHGNTRTSKRRGYKTTSWIEVKTLNETWIYDVDLMIKIKKSYFEELESPEELKRYTKAEILSHPAHNDSVFTFEYIPMIILSHIKRYEQDKKNPHYQEIQAEIKRYKKEINFDRAVRDYYRELDYIHGKK